MVCYPFLYHLIFSLQSRRSSSRVYCVVKMSEGTVGCWCEKEMWEMGPVVERGATDSDAEQADGEQRREHDVEQGYQMVVAF